MSPNRESKLREAIETVRQAGLDPDGPGGAAALAFLLSGPASAATGEARSESSPDEAPSADDPAGEIAHWLDADASQVGDVIEFREDGALPRVPARRLPGSKAERQRVLAVMKLAADRVAYGREEVPARAVNAVCAEYASLDQNLPQNLAASGGLLSRRGQRGAYRYRATQPGIERGRALLRELLSGTEGELEL